MSLSLIIGLMLLSFQGDGINTLTLGGLVFAIAKAIARSHGVSLTVKSELGKGSIFIVQLPLVGSKKTA